MHTSVLANAKSFSASRSVSAQGEHSTSVKSPREEDSDRFLLESARKPDAVPFSAYALEQVGTKQDSTVQRVIRRGSHAAIAAGAAYVALTLARPVGACPVDCYRSEAADIAMVTLAAATGILFGVVGGPFVGAGAAMMTKLYIENIKMECRNIGCGPFMRP